MLVSYVIEDPQGTERVEHASKLPRAKRIAKEIYKDAFPDVWQYVELYFSTRRDGTIDLVCDDGRAAWATGITVRREK